MESVSWNFRLMHWINLATEDELSEVVGLRLIEELGPGFCVNLKLRKNGNGYLRAKIESFCQMSRRAPLLLLTDLDSGICAPELLAEWLGGTQLPENFLFRVAVREIESWLLADRQAMKSLLGKGASSLRGNPESLSNPKQTLLLLARKASRAVRKDLLASTNAYASQGLGYNQRLCSLVRNDWSPARAAVNSASLKQARMRLRVVAERMSRT